MELIIELNLDGLAEPLELFCLLDDLGFDISLNGTTDKGDLALDLIDDIFLDDNILSMFLELELGGLGFALDKIEGP